MATEKINALVIKKDPFFSEVYPKPLKVTTELHSRVRNLAFEANLPIHKIACMLIEFALNHAEVKD